MKPRPDAILFDLFGTLITFDVSALPEIEVDGQRLRSTVGLWGPLLDDVLPGIGPAAFVRALRRATETLRAECPSREREISARARFIRAVALVGRPADAEEVGPLLARAHHRAIAGATRFPREHARVLAAARTRGPVAVVTNFDDTAAAYEILGRHGILGEVASVVVSEAVGLRKPHKVLVEIALRDVGVDAARALFVGDDAVADLGAAAAAGVDAVWIDTQGAGLPTGRAAPRHVIRALPELEPLL